VVAALRSRLEGFQKHLPLVTALRNPGLRERHWARVADVAGLQLSGPAGGLTVARALSAGLPAKLEAIEEISEFASKEYALERALDKMQVRPWPCTAAVQAGYSQAAMYCAWYCPAGNMMMRTQGMCRARQVASRVR
jgi:hypothetical protein